MLKLINWCFNEALMKSLGASEGTSCFVFMEIFSEVCADPEKKKVVAF